MTILSNMSGGKGLINQIIPTDSEVSTQQGADMLNVSRPHLIKLLENNNHSIQESREPSKNLATGFGHL